MKNNQNETKVVDKRAYQTPKVVVYGDVRQLTQSGSGGPGEGVGSFMT